MKFSIMYWMGNETSPNSTQNRRDQELLCLGIPHYSHKHALTYLCNPIYIQNCTPYPSAPFFFYIVLTIDSFKKIKNVRVLL